jgi:U3 small nucleolar RNA-associated protein 13
VKLWQFDGSSGVCQSVWTVKAHEKEINALCFSPCGKMLISAAQDKTIRIWSVAEGKLMHTLTGHKRGVWSLACVREQEAILASGSADRTVKLWRLCEDFSCVKTFEGHANSVLRVGFMNAGNQLVSAGSDGLIKIWDIKRSECMVTLDEHVDRIWALNVIDDGCTLVTGDASAHIKFWQDVSAEERTAELKRNDEILLKEQELQVLLLRKEFPKAVLLALSLEQPFRLYGLFGDLLKGRSIEDALTLLGGLIQEIPSLDDLVKLLTWLREWNISYRRSFASQILLAAVLRSSRFGDLIKEKPEMREVLQGILPYTQKHYERTDELMIDSQIVDFALLHMN